MKSEYLNENKICELFQDEDLGPRREEISLNLTVTSRDNSYNPYITHPDNGITIALNELDKFNSWFSGLSCRNDKLLQDISQFVEDEDNHPTLLSTPDFRLLRKKCNPKSCQIIRPSPILNQVCHECTRNSDLIQMIKEEHETKIQQCNCLKLTLNQLRVEKQQNEQQALRERILDGVESNLLKQENEELKNVLVQLKNEIERSRMQKSALQKSASLLKTKDLERRLECANNIKSFSNAKNSTNPTNPSDTFNRVDSIISFECEPNFQDLIKYFSEEASSWKNKCLHLISEQQNQIGHKMNSESRNKFIREFPEKRMHECCHQIQRCLTDIRNERVKSPQFRGRKIQYLDSNASQSEVREMRRKVICLQTQVKNLVDTNQDLVQRYKQLGQEQQHKNAQIKKYKLSCKMVESELQKTNIQFKSLYQAYQSDIKVHRKLLNEVEDRKGGLRVYCRVRPRFGSEVKTKSAISCCSSKLRVAGDEKQYVFDHIFREKHTQQRIFSEVKNLVECAYDGRNVCILTCGQNRSGKTFTLHGTEQQPGLTPRIINQLFDIVDKNRKFDEITITLRIFQVYKDSLMDLSGEQKVQMKQDESGKLYFNNDYNVKVENRTQIFDLYRSALAKRECFQSKVNSVKNKSHGVFIIEIMTVSHARKETKISKISIVELAAFEKGAMGSNTQKQTVAVNRGLLNLANCISAIETQQEHIPYRDSKLTILLKDSLNSQSKIVMFINISPCETHLPETLNPLNFAHKIRGLSGADRNVQLRRKESIHNKKENSNTKVVTVTRRSSSRLSAY